MNAPLVASVMIPSFQSARTIEACLASVFAQVNVGPFEVIVADSSTDETAELIARHYPAVRLLKSATRMSAETARNWAAREARAPILALIDSDCVADRDWLRRLCDTFEDPAVHGVGGAIRNRDGSNSVAWAGYFCEFKEFLPRGVACDATYLTPNNAAYRRDTFQRAGGFPVGYFPMEDQVFYDRLRRVGARIRFDPSISVLHVCRSSFAAFLRHQKLIGAANALIVCVLGIRGARIASRPWLAAALLPALTTYRFARTVAACWRQERFLMIRRPWIAGLCWLGMLAWGVGFTQPLASPEEGAP